MLEINRIQKRKVSEEIVGEIKRLISKGVFLTDQKLPSETELAHQFGVSRSSIREALSMLASAEIIETRQGEGTYVRKVQIGDYIHPLVLSMVTEKEQALHLLEMRQIFEIGTVEIAAARRNENDLAELKQTILELEMQLKLGESGMEADFHFHRAIAEATKNPLLIQTMENLTHVMKQSLEYTHSHNVGNTERRWRVLKEHQEIFACIEKGDSHGAVAALKEHLENVRNKLKALDH
ncbi:FadR/GntR family transcriptional regulator [Brevibacillus sp. B_LB10_24]|uniref:FadR/GntR family transcriptional regulator n=1 Tax=Brevibacillus sp. B_LB10_24 TaxID=3380645 RepID=UPI0038BCEF94